MGNTAPVADAGVDQGVTTGALVTLDGTGSSDGDGDEITYSWTILSNSDCTAFEIPKACCTGDGEGACAPDGNSATLSDKIFHSPTFTPDLVGEYIIELVVNDGFENSVADSVTVTASTPPP